MPGPSPRTVVLLAGLETLPGLDRSLRDRGIRPIRIEPFGIRPVPPRRWLPRLARRRAPDTLLVTSRTAVEAGVRPWVRTLAAMPPSLEAWAAGPGTAEALRPVVRGRIRTPSAIGGAAVVRALGPTPRRRILYLRSDRAGPDLARALRARGHIVYDVVAYRLVRLPPLRAPLRQALERARLLVAASPSGIEHLRARMERPAWRRLVADVPVVVLGDRSAKAARRAGFERIVVAPSTEPVRFTRLLLRELGHAGA